MKLMFEHYPKLQEVLAKRVGSKVSKRYLTRGSICVMPTRQAPPMRRSSWCNLQFLQISEYACVIAAGELLYVTAAERDRFDLITVNIGLVPVDGRHKQILGRLEIPESSQQTFDQHVCAFLRAHRSELTWSETTMGLPVDIALIGDLEAQREAFRVYQCSII